MQKSIIIAIIIVLLFVVAGVVLVNTTGEKRGPMSEAPASDEFSADTQELDRLGVDLNTFGSEEKVLVELEDAMQDASNTTAISPFDESAIESESSAADFSGDLDAFSEESAVLDEAGGGMNDIIQ